MEKEDKIIKALLNEELIETAPDGFTNRVMNTIELAELQKDQSYKADWLYLLIIAGSFFFALGIIALIDSSYISRYFYVFVGYASNVFHQMTTIFDHTKLTNSSILSGSGLVLGTFLIMIALLVFDSFVLKKKRYLNLFVWSF